MLPAIINSKSQRHTQRALWHPHGRACLGWNAGLRVYCQLGILMWLTMIWFGYQCKGDCLLALSNLVHEILASLQGEIQLKQEGEFEEGWSGECLLFCQTSVWILDGENLSIQSNVLYVPIIIQTKEQLTAHDHLKIERFLFSNLVTAFSVSTCKAS